jgi:hypothetical protein
MDISSIEIMMKLSGNESMVFEDIIYISSDESLADILRKNFDTILLYSKVYDLNRKNSYIIEYFEILKEIDPYYNIGSTTAIAVQSKNSICKIKLVDINTTNSHDFTFYI